MTGRAVLAWRSAAAAAWVLAAVVAALQYRHALTVSYLGVDVRPLQDAGRALLDGRDVYAVRYFVYPPAAAVLAVPLALVPRDPLEQAGAAVTLLAVAALAAGSVRLFVPPRAWRPALAGTVAAALLGGMATHHAVPLDNVSVLVTPAVLGLAAWWGRGRWWAGCALLGATLLVKPLLAPLVLVPFLARRWREPLATGAATALVAAASLALTGAGRVGDVAARLLRGSILVGSRAANNLSLTGVATVHPQVAPWLTAARAVVVLVALAGCAGAAGRPRALDPARVAWLATVLLAAVYLAGNLSEVHYLYALVPGGVALAAQARPRPLRVAGALALGVVCLPLWSAVPRTEQVFYVGAELALLVAAAAALVVPPVAAAPAVPASPSDGARVTTAGRGMG